jgi:hypothetical protein
MRANRCPAHCGGPSRSRREFLAAASVASASLLSGRWLLGQETPLRRAEPKGPAAGCVPTIKACFVRRKGEYGLRWPGQVYDGEAARARYLEQLAATAKQLKATLDLRPEPLISAEEADAWVAEAAKAKPDGLLVVLLDRQEHAWPTAGKALATKIPTVVFSPVGSSFTTNTAAPSRQPGGFLCSTDDFRQVQYGLKMLCAGAKMRATRCLVVKGSPRADATMPGLGIQLRTVPAKAYLDAYQKAPADAEVQAIAADYLKRARRQVGATKDDVLHGARAYVVARGLLEAEQGDAITMDCLGVLGPTKLSLPCLAWSRLNDDGVPAACEADLGAAATHILVQYLFDRPGFQQDPVGETAREAIIGAHCSCPTRLKGFGEPPEPFDLVHHHACRDATARPVWRVGQRVTSADVLLGRPDEAPKMIISAGEVLDNVAVPPAGGCVVSVLVKFDGVTDVLAYPGFHQVFFYGDFKRELVQFCRLFRIEPVVV